MENKTKSISNKRFVSKEEKEAKEKVKQMDIFDRLEYFFDYYKYHVIVAVLLFGALFSIVYDRYIDPPETSILNTVLYTGYVSETQLEDVKLLIDEVVDYDEKSETISVTSLMKTAEASTDQYSAEMVLMARVSVSEIDLLIMNQEDFKAYSANGMFLAIDEYINNQQLDLSDDQILITMNDEKTEKMFGVKLAESLEFINVDEDMYVGIVANTNNIDNAIKALNAITGNNN